MARQVPAHGESLGRLIGREDRLDGAAAGGPGQVLGQHLGGLHLLDPGQAPDQLGILRGQQLALAPLPRLVPVRQVQHGAPLLPVEQQVGVRGLDPAQVVELVRLAEDFGTRREGGARHDGQPGADALGDLLPAAAKFFGRKVGLNGHAAGWHRRSLG